MSYKVIYDKENCIGANSCVGVFPEYWSLDGAKKAVLKDSTLNKETGRYELIVDDQNVERFKESALVCPVFVIDIVDMRTQKSILNINGSKEVEKESAPVIQARAGAEKEFQTDPKGYFTIKSYSETGLIKVWYYGPKHQLLFIIEGRNGEAICATIVREGFVTSLYHAVYLGSELQKAEIALKKGVTYIQDKPLP